MPELPDIVSYVNAMNALYVGETIEKVVVRSPFLLRTFDIDINDLADKKVLGFSRIGKRIVWQVEGELFLVVHLMIAGRFHKRKPGKLPVGKNELAGFLFDNSTLMLTEAGTKKRASLHLVRGQQQLDQFDRDGLDVLKCTARQFVDRVRSQNRTLKRMLTDPTIFDGIGNAYSDEILLEAGLSPYRHSTSLREDECQKLFQATKDILQRFIELLAGKNGDQFPEKVTAFRPEMLAHGKFDQPCGKCGTKIQRVRFAENEMNYCPRCQTGGKILADRSLSRLLKDDWPKTIEELEN